jgi:hypothetical protein
MSLWWLRYDRGGRFHGVLLIDARSLVSARLKASVYGLDLEATFIEGHEIGHALAPHISPDLRGRMLSSTRAGALIRILERKADAAAAEAQVDAAGRASGRAAASSRATRCG